MIPIIVKKFPPYHFKKKILIYEHCVLKEQCFDLCLFFQRSTKFPRAQYFCHLCEYHCDTIEICINHIKDTRHSMLAKKQELDTTLFHLPRPNKKHLALPCSPNINNYSPISPVQSPNSRIPLKIVIQHACCVPSPSLCNEFCQIWTGSDTIRISQICDGKWLAEGGFSVTNLGSPIRVCSCPDFPSRPFSITFGKP